MNKELIKKYKKEFDYWLDNKNGLLFYDEHHNGWYNLHCDYQWNCTVEEIEEFGKYGYVINDEYVELRKALAEGKTIQFLQGIKNNTEWINADESYFNGCGTNYLRIKPEEVIETKEPDVKIGDFIIVNPINPLNQKCIKKVKNITFSENTVLAYVFDDESCAFEKYVKLWKPKKNELVWKRNSKWSNKYESILSNWTKETEVIYDLIEPYIEGKLPSWIKL